LNLSPGKDEQSGLLTLYNATN